MNSSFPQVQPPEPEPPPPAPRSYSPFWPILIVLLTLNVSVIREMVVLNTHKETASQENAPIIEQLKKSGKEVAFIESLHGDLQQLALTDPVAAQIIAEFFTPPAPPQPNKPENAAKAPPQ